MFKGSWLEDWVQPHVWDFILFILFTSLSPSFQWDIAGIFLFFRKKESNNSHPTPLWQYYFPCLWSKRFLYPIDFIMLARLPYSKDKIHNPGDPGWGMEEPGVVAEPTAAAQLQFSLSFARNLCVPGFPWASPAQRWTLSTRISADQGLGG